MLSAKADSPVGHRNVNGYPPARLEFDLERVDIRRARESLYVFGEPDAEAGARAAAGIDEARVENARRRRRRSSASLTVSQSPNLIVAASKQYDAWGGPEDDRVPLRGHAVVVDDERDAELGLGDAVRRREQGEER